MSMYSRAKGRRARRHLGCPKQRSEETLGYASCCTSSLAECCEPLHSRDQVRSNIRSTTRVSKRELWQWVYYQQWFQPTRCRLSRGPGGIGHIVP